MLCATAFSLSAATELPPSSPTDVTAAFYIRDGKGSVKGSLKAPTESNDYINPQPLGIISLIEVTRSCWELGESDIPVARFEQAVPGMLYTFEDEGLTAYELGRMASSTRVWLLPILQCQEPAQLFSGFII